MKQEAFGRSCSRHITRVALVGALALAACSEQPEGAAGAIVTDQSFAENPAPGLVSPQQLRAGPSYAVSAGHAVNALRGMEIDFDRDAVHVVTEEAAASFRLVRVGRGDVELALRGDGPESQHNRVDYDKGDLREWYLNGPLGLQQGFTFERRPEGEGLVEITLEVEGLTPQHVGSDIELHAEGEAVLFYGGLQAADAEGTPLATALAVVDGRIVLRVADEGARYPVYVDPIIVTEVSTVTGSDTAPGDEFGGTPALTAGGPAVAIDGDVAIVAAPFDGGRDGGVYIFRRAAGVWAEETKLLRTTTGRFGYSVDIEGDRAVVGAPGPGGVGSFHVYERSGTAWPRQYSAAALGPSFGTAVALSGDRVVVGARYDQTAVGPGGVAVVYLRDAAGSWGVESNLQGADTALNDDFGSTVAIDGDTVVVGAAFHPALTRTGAAYVFTRSGTTWTEEAKLVASDAASLDLFSRSIAVDGDRVLVGAPQNEVTLFNQGAVYVYRRAGVTWPQSERLVASDAELRDQFGWSVALDGGYAIAGARFGDAAGEPADSGLMYAFRDSAGAFIDEMPHARSGGVAGDRFGDSVGVSGTTAVVGAPFASSRRGNATFLALCDGCRVDSVCYADGTTNPADPCLICDVATSNTAWTAGNDGMGCDDGQFCTTGDVCAAGACVGGPRDCSDGLTCTDDDCDDAIDECTHVVTTGCLVAGTCVIEGAANPDNVCQACNAALATDAYSNVADDTICGDPSCADAMLTLAPTCSAGACTPGATGPCPDGSLCASATMCTGMCTDDSMCATGFHCDIGGTEMCVADLPVGSACDRVEVCADGFCSDGVCCDGGCDGTCESCAIAGTEGTCSPIASGEDPDDECSLACDGAGACQVPEDAGVPDAGTDGGVDDAGVADAGVADGAVGDGAVGDGAVGDGAVGDGAVGDGAVADGALPDGALPDGALPDGAGFDAGGGVTGGGCGCHTAGTGSNDAHPLGLALLAGVFVYRRRRRR